ncbi:MAG: hypothetical protein SVS15_08770 [Thermodesulfobacteriota bacterium]|nr:hypothetical protein [Thermodesulfobacteriota bacterium]
MDVIFPLLLTGFFTLAAVALTSRLNNWRRREHLLSVVFNKKIDAYERILRETYEILHHVLSERSAEGLSKLGEELLARLGGALLLASPEVLGLVTRFGSLCQAEEMGVDEQVTSLAKIHTELRGLCQKELGIAKLQSELVK